MEHPPAARSFIPEATAGRKATHDFLSLYSTTTTAHSQDQRSSPGSFLKTQNFLQPLERVEMSSSKEGNPASITVKNKTQLPAASYLAPTSVEQILPGGIGTYTISHISYINQVPKPEVSIFTVDQASSNERNDDNSNNSSQTGSGFTLWEKSAVDKGKTGKENVGDRTSIVREPASKLAQWTAERPSQSSLNQRGSFTSASSSLVTDQKNQNFMDLIVSTKSAREDDEDCQVDFMIKKEGSTSEREDFKMRTEGKSSESKANTPKSKHSATEQRRRSKINDRFLMLREIIPHSDQKRDKASFLLEAIEYIQYLQEKVHRYEGSFPAWKHESAKQMPLRNNCQPTEGLVDRPRPIPGASSTTSLFSMKSPDKNIRASSTVSRVVQKQDESDMGNPIAFKMNDHHLFPTNKIVVHPIPSQPKLTGSGGTTLFPPRLVTETENSTSQLPQQGDDRQCKTDHAILNDEGKNQELAIEGGTINISSTYSQGFLNTLTQALQSLGVDLSQSKISVQIELGKQTNIKLGSIATMTKVGETNSTRQVKKNSMLLREQSDQAAKRLKTSNQ
ncbi:unnamed protein product [Rhodiola kirilowii]